MNKIRKAGLLLHITSLPSKFGIGDLGKEAYRFEDCNFLNFCKENNYWIEDYALFQALREKTGKEWYEWEDKVKRRDKKTIEKLKKELHKEIKFHKFVQYVFFKQWKELKDYANDKGIRMFGDVPIYPAYFSVDVWKNPEIFKLDENLRPVFVAGVPPDYFSPTGQLWGNPVYNWYKLEEENFSFWIERFKHYFKLFDYLRLDHFRGFVGYWEVPFGEKTAKRGRWGKAPAKKFFKTILSLFPKDLIIVEDLGFITDEVRYVRDFFGLTGMKVLQFTFYEDNSEYLPHNHVENSVVFTGTHDNPPSRVWFKNLNEISKERFFKYIGRKVKEENASRELIRLAYMSVAFMTVIPVQDILNLGEEATMNIPGRKYGNWEWRLKAGELNKKTSEYLSELVLTYGR